MPSVCFGSWNECCWLLCLEALGLLSLTVAAEPVRHARVAVRRGAGLLRRDSYAQACAAGAAGLIIFMPTARTGLRLSQFPEGRQLVLAGLPPGQALSPEAHAPDRLVPVPPDHYRSMRRQ